MCRGASRRTSSGFEGFAWSVLLHHLLVPAGEAARGRVLTVLQGSPHLSSRSWQGWSWEKGSGKLLWGWDVVGRVEKSLWSITVAGCSYTRAVTFAVPCKVWISVGNLLSSRCEVGSVFPALFPTVHPHPSQVVPLSSLVLDAGKPRLWGMQCYWHRDGDLRTGIRWQREEVPVMLCLYVVL